MKRAGAIVAAFLVLSAGCKSPAESATEDHEPRASRPLPKVAEGEPTRSVEKTMVPAPAAIVGETSREAIEGQFESWSAANAAEPDAQASNALAGVEPGAVVDVYLGTWCGDSRREVPRLWRALDAAGDVPFELRYVGVDREFSAGAVSLEGKDLIAVPTFVVTRGGHEVGRVVEKSPGGIESDLLSLLNGSKTGKISATR